MEGFEVGERYDTMGLRGNDLRRLRFNDVRVPAENLLGEPGEGFRIAMQVLNNGRLSFGTGSVGLAKKLIDLTIDHVQERRQFGQPLADFDMVEDKIGWMVSYLFGLESMSYLTTGLVDTGVEDYSVESAMCKVTGTEFVWYQANRAMQLAGGQGYMRTEPYEQIMRDIRIFPIFEGANDVLRSYVALTALKPLGEEIGGLADLDLRDPLGSLGTVADYVVGRVRREVRPDRLSGVHSELSDLADAVADQVKRLRAEGEGLLRRHGKEIVRQGMSHKRYAHALDGPLRPGRGDLAGDARSSRSRGPRPRPGALHRRDVLHARRAPRERRARPARGQRRRPDALDRPDGLQARGLRVRAVRSLSRGARAVPLRSASAPPWRSAPPGQLRATRARSAERGDEELVASSVAVC